jgi:CTP:molybdopterin cytidylyltransferase MocA
MFSSVKMAFEGSDGQATLVLPVDAGFVTPDSILSVIAYFLGLEGRDNLAVIPAYGGYLGHPPVIGQEFQRKVLFYKGERGLRGALAYHVKSREESEAVMAAKMPGPESLGSPSSLRYLALDDPLVLTDIDTHGDLKRFEIVRSKSVFRPVPTAEKALALMALACPETKIAHSLIVAIASLRLALAIGSKALSLAFVGGALHDLCHGLRDHAMAARDRLALIGWPEEVSAVVGNHTEIHGRLRQAIGLEPMAPKAGPLSWSHAGHPEVTRELMEATLCVHLADKYIMGTELVGLEARFNPAWAKDMPEAWPYIAARRLDALAIDKWFKDRLPEPIEKVLVTPMDHPLESLAFRAAGSPVGPSQRSLGTRPSMGSMAP